MPKGNVLPDTNKTEFMRWLNDHEKDVASLMKFQVEYRAIKPRGNNFGVWLRGQHLQTFTRTYQRFWLRHPELFGLTYKTEPLRPVYLQARQFCSPTAAIR